ncbi:MAG TPA: SagB/ThcOx family dehydrogenase [Kofleriaceae bacterium]|nr:SagB/ThcOx family dehydrogenase [Kofleriaceae bacterium]
MATEYLILGALALMVLGSGGPAWAQPPAATKLPERRALPAPQRDGGPALATVLATRRSTRVFARRELSDGELAQLLWAAQGVTDSQGGHRAAPSAGALYPITVRVVDAKGTWRYVPAEHALVRESTIDTRDRLRSAAHGQESVGSAPATLVITANVAITAGKYGDRAERFATLEAGHVAQNLLLTATALGLAAVPVGAFDDGASRKALGLAASETPLYLIPIGARP